jgi:rhodanese-related sulfurtransferase
MRTLVLMLLIVPRLAAAADRFEVLHVGDLAQRLAAPGARISLWDANVESTRTHVGVIPGSHLLGPGEDPVARLPPDKAQPLVFYCANTYCTASHQAAERATDAGYTRVAVMVDGIYGWRDAKQPLRKLQAAPHKLTPGEVSALHKQHKAVIIDVREQEERHEIVPGAQWIPMSEVNDPAKWAAFVKRMPADQTVVFYCARGVRAKRAAELLREEGRASGFFESPDEWQAAGLPISPGPAR